MGSDIGASRTQHIAGTPRTARRNSSNSASEVCNLHRTLRSDSANKRFRHGVNEWRTLLTATVLLGLLYIPSDIKGLPGALRAPLGFLVTYKETLILLYALALALWIAWRNARPHLKPRLATVLGRHPRSEVIGKLDDYLA